MVTGRGEGWRCRGGAGMPLASRTTLGDAGDFRGGRSRAIKCGKRLVGTIGYEYAT